MLSVASIKVYNYRNTVLLNNHEFRISQSLCDYTTTILSRSICKRMLHRELFPMLTKSLMRFIGKRLRKIFIFSAEKMHLTSNFHYSGVLLA